MNEPDLRWKQRFSNFVRALRNLEDAVQLMEMRALSDLEKKGVIQDFEITIELAWKVLKDYLTYEGIGNVATPRAAIREAFNKALIEDGQVWIDMIDARNQTSHTYDATILERLFEHITQQFYPAFQAMATQFTRIYEQA